MKLIAGVILSLSLLELIHCVPLIDSDDGGFKETNTTSSWGYNAGVDANIGLEAGWNNGHGILGTKNHIGVNFGGQKANSQKDTNYAINPVPAPNNTGSGLGYPGYPATGALNYPAAGSPYYPAPSSQYYYAPGSVYYPPPDSQYYNQFAPQPTQAQGAQQYAPAQQYVPAQQYAPAQQYVPAQQYIPAQQYVPLPQNAPVLPYVQQGAPQQVPEGTS